MHFIRGFGNPLSSLGARESPKSLAAVREEEMKKLMLDEEMKKDLDSTDTPIDTSTGTSTIYRMNKGSNDSGLTPTEPSLWSQTLNEVYSTFAPLREIKDTLNELEFGLKKGKTGKDQQGIGGDETEKIGGKQDVVEARGDKLTGGHVQPGGNNIDNNINNLNEVDNLNQVGKNKDNNNQNHPGFDTYFKVDEDDFNKFIESLKHEQVALSPVEIVQDTRHQNTKELRDAFLNSMYDVGRLIENEEASDDSLDSSDDDVLALSDARRFALTKKDIYLPAGASNAANGVGHVEKDVNPESLNVENRQAAAHARGNTLLGFFDHHTDLLTATRPGPANPVQQPIQQPIQEVTQEPIQQPELTALRLAQHNRWMAMKLAKDVEENKLGEQEEQGQSFTKVWF